MLRVKVKITCKQCGEKFILRGTYVHGELITGFKQCLCDNEMHFEIEPHES